MCIESDGVAPNFSARQQLVRSAWCERNEPLAKARSDANSGLDGGSAIFRHSKLESATGNWNLHIFLRCRHPRALSTTLKTPYDLNGATLKLLLTSSFLGMFIGAAALGRLADRIGRRRAFLFNLIWFSLWTKAWTPRDTALGDDGRMPILVEPTIVADVWSSTDQPSIPADPQTVMRPLSKSDAAAVAESVP